MGANPRVAAVLKTETFTPALSRWLKGLLEEILTKGPKASREVTFCQRELDLLNVALKNFKEHRGKDDPERPTSHRQLYRTFNDVVSRTVTVLNQRVKLETHQLILPTTEAAFQGRVRQIIADGQWLFVCSHCGRDRRDQKDYWIEGDCCLCPGCVERYTVSCVGCKGRTMRDKVHSSRIVRDNDTQKDAFYCPKCAGNAKDGPKCTHCGCGYINGPSGGVDDVTPEEIKKAGGGELCYACASIWERGDCGHVSPSLEAVVAVENVEDDCRDREDVGQRAAIHVCHSCRDLYRAQDNDIDTWAVKKPKCSSKSYDDLRSKRSYGVELEVCQPKKMRPMSEEIKSYWTSKRDASLPEIGIELASTILFGDTGLKVIKDVCDYAERHDWRVDTRAGFHLHVGLPDEGYQRIAAVAMGYHMTYDLWSSFVAPSRQRCKYCRKNSYSAEDLYKQSPSDLIHMLLNDPAIEGRRCWVNWHAYSLHSTVEIRLHHGTLKYDKISNWVKAHTRFVDWCIKQGSHEKVFQRLSGLSVRKQFLLITQEAWKDRRLGRWYRNRALELFDGCAPLPASNRKLRKAGVDPSHYRPGFSFQVDGKSAYIIRLGDREYVIGDHPGQSTRAKYISEGGWDSQRPIRFKTRVDSITFLKEVSRNGLPSALGKVKVPPKAKRATENREWRTMAGRFRAVPAPAPHGPEGPRTNPW